MIQHNFFINTHSNVVSNWHKASYFLQNGINTFDEGYQFRSYYWFKRSQEQYKYINENEDRKSLREGANELIESNKLFSYLNFVEEIEYEFYYREANMHIKQANEYFSTRFCDSCNKRKKIMNMSMFISEEDNTYNIYCNSCYNNQSTNNTKSQNNKNTYKQNKKQNNSKRNNINNKDNIMTVSKAKKILNIKGSVTEDKLNKKYKQAVKKTHPDVGGSVDEFKKTQEAKDVLESHIS